MPERKEKKKNGSECEYGMRKSAPLLSSAGGMEGERERENEGRLD